MDTVKEFIVEWFTDILKDMVDIVVDFISSIVFNYDGLAGTALSAYNMFVWLSAILLVVLCLYEVIKMLVSEADESQEANAWAIIVNTIRSGFILVLTPFIISITMNVVRALSEFFFTDMGDTLKDNIDEIANLETGLAIFENTIGVFIIIGFVVLVLIAFIFKIVLEQANILMLEILSPITAISITNENFDQAKAWSQDLLSHAVTIVVLTLTIALFTESLGALAGANDFNGSVTALASVIGTGALIFTGPSLIQSLRYKSGVGSASKSLGNTLVRAKILRK